MYHEGNFDETKQKIMYFDQNRKDNPVGGILYANIFNFKEILIKNRLALFV